MIYLVHNYTPGGINGSAQRRCCHYMVLMRYSFGKDNIKNVAKCTVCDPRVNVEKLHEHVTRKQRYGYLFIDGVTVEENKQFKSDIFVDR